MQKLLLTLALAALTPLCHGQGTIAFGNSALTKITTRSPDGTGQTPLPASAGYVFGVFYGSANSSQGQLQLAPGLAQIGTTAGVLVNAPSVFALPGTEPGQIVSLQIRGWSASFGNDWAASCRAGYFGETDVRQVTLAPTAGPGSVIWQTATGTNPNRFTPLVIGLAGDPLCIPEPSTLALSALSCLLLFLRGRNSTNN